MPCKTALKVTLNLQAVRSTENEFRLAFPIYRYYKFITKMSDEPMNQ